MSPTNPDASVADSDPNHYKETGSESTSNDQSESRKWIRSPARWQFIMEQWRITSGEVEAHNRAVKAHPGAVEGLQASVADFYHSNEDPYRHEKGRIRFSWKWRLARINVCGSATLRVNAKANRSCPIGRTWFPIPSQNSQNGHPTTLSLVQKNFLPNASSSWRDVGLEPIIMKRMCVRLHQHLRKTWCTYVRTVRLLIRYRNVISGCLAYVANIWASGWKQITVQSWPLCSGSTGSVIKRPPG